MPSSDSVVSDLSFSHIPSAQQWLLGTYHVAIHAFKRQVLQLWSLVPCLSDNLHKHSCPEHLATFHKPTPMRVIRWQNNLLALASLVKEISCSTHALQKQQQDW